MKKQIYHYNRFLAMLRVFEKYAAQFNGKLSVKAIIVLFVANTKHIGELLSKLARPRKTLIGPRMDKAAKLRKSLYTMADLGILMGASRKDDPQVDLFMEIRKGSYLYNIWDMHQAALQAYGELAAYPEESLKIELTDEMLEAFKLQTDEFGEILESTDALLKERKADREELRSLFKANTPLLRLHIEPALRFEAASTPALLREYLIARKTGARKKQQITEDLLTEISGTVTNIITGLPVVNAIVDIAELELITTTDADGYYQFDEVPVGDIIVGCHATSYRLPEKVKVKGVSGESLQIDFNLQPEAGE